MSGPSAVSGDKATLDTPAELVAREVAAVVSRSLGSGLRSLVLTGSLARGEATFLRVGEVWKAFGDAEFLIVLAEGRPAPDPRVLAEEARENLAHHRVFCKLDLAPVRTAYLRALPPHIFAYELRVSGRVLCGDPDVLRLIPEFSPADIPLEDGWRLLSNRLVEILEWPVPLPSPGDELPEDVGYRSVKLCLDAATSYLLFRGAYQPTYRARADQLRALVDGESLTAPLPLRPFLALVQNLTRAKLEPGAGPAVGWTEWRSILTWALALWDYETGVLLGSQDLAAEKALERLAQQQPPLAKIRGWLSAWRVEGPLGGLRLLPQIARRALLGSPRYQLYALAAEVLRGLSARLPATSAPDPDGARCLRLARALPARAPGTRPAARPPWQELADDILWNYRRFLEKTRS